MLYYFNGVYILPLRNENCNDNDTCVSDFVVYILPLRNENFKTKNNNKIPIMFISYL